MNDTRRSHLTFIKTEDTRQYKYPQGDNKKVDGNAKVATNS
ncbi:hypothetical protein EVA_10496 [gut metagenome]|uniref:Uncharacterized protein n=1 Tax=gut metagenome TaxID=749906 RepID=J9G3H9_9ZZZZ